MSIPPSDPHCHALRQIQFDQKLAALQISLRDRMRFYKLAVEPQGSQIAATFNHTRAPDVVPENDDPEYLRVKESLRTKDTLIGEEVRLPCSWVLYVLNYV